MAVMELRDVTYSYPNGKLILCGISRVFDAGRMYVIYGPSGCGKTTLLSLMGGLDVQTGGSIYFQGTEITPKRFMQHRRRNVCFIFQNYNLIDYLTPVENVRLASNSGSTEMLRKVGLTNEECTRSVLKLSGGQQQRVAIARALVGNHPMILADEPTGNLDEEMSEEIIRILRSAAHETGKCLVVVSHAQEMAKAADVLLELKNGHLSEA